MLGYAGAGEVIIHHWPDREQWRNGAETELSPAREQILRVLCAGDLHIGRKSSKVPSEFDDPRHSCAAAWASVVDLAISERVDLVALSGDMVDRANRFFEAIGPLERGLRRLDEAGIETVAVAGNHDFDVLPNLADTLDSSQLHLLGRGGGWERLTIRQEGRPVLHVDGRSFTQETVFENPLEGYSCSNDGIPILGLLHADLDQAQSRYGPVSLADLRRQPVSFWLLGHIHRPYLYSDDVGPSVLYPGSPQAMDPGEPGVHGAWIVEFKKDGTVDQRLLPLSTVRYETIPVDVTGLDTEDSCQQAIAAALRDALSKAAENRGSLLCLCCRLRLTGRTALHRKLPNLIRSAKDDLWRTVANVTGIVEQVIFETQPALDLASIAVRNDPPGEIARLIRAFERDEQPVEYRDLLYETTARLRSVYLSRPFADIATDSEPEVAQARECVLREAWSLLDTLVAQKEGA